MQVDLKLELKEKLLVWFWGCRYYCSLPPLHTLKIFHLSVHFCFFICTGIVLFCTLAQFSRCHLSYLFKIFHFNMRLYRWKLSCKFIQTGLSAKYVLSLNASKKSVAFYGPLKYMVHSICPWKSLHLFKVAVWLGMSPYSLPQMWT